MSAPQPALGIILVNWNRWADTIECLESVFRSTIPVQVVVVDNASADGSLERVEAWAAGRLAAEAASPAMAPLSTPPLAKPIACERLSAADMSRSPAPGIRLTLIDSGGNLGFAGGNNVGLRYLQALPNIAAFWLLNNDTVVEPAAAAELLDRMNRDPSIGMCGTMVRYYHQPDTVQALGGSRFNVLTGQSVGIGWRQPASQPFDADAVAAETDFVLGASLAVSRSFLDTVGPMEESYFLYYEEIDWAVRSAGRFRIGMAGDAVVFHKEGGSIGSSSTAGARSNTAEYWLARSRLAFIRRHHPLLLPWHWLLTLALVPRRLLRRQPRKAGLLLRALLGQQY